MLKRSLVAATLCASLVAPVLARAAGEKAAAPPARDSSTTTVFLVRHAEKNTTVLGADPPLSDAGERRALALRHALRDVGVTTIFVTHWQRTRLTAAPLAQALGESLTVVDAVDETVRRIQAQPPGSTVLVVGHSDTIPAIIQALAGRIIAPFVEGDWDRLFVVTLSRDRPPSVITLHYGEASAAK